jgi:hypothetical protein
MKIDFKNITNNKYLFPISIFLIALFLRIYKLNLMEFKADEALSLLQIIRFFEKPYFIQTGLISSTGMHNLPLFHYLLIPLSVFSRHPLSITFFIALINSILVSFFYLVLKKYYGFLVAIIGSLSLAVSPFSILLSRKIWAQDLILLFVIPIFYFLHRLIIDKHKKSTYWLFLLLMLLPQLHNSGLFLLITTIIFLIIKKVKIDINQVFLAFFTAFLFALPFVFFQLNSQPICLDCQNFLLYQKIPKPYQLQNLYQSFLTLNGLGFEYFLGKDYLSFLTSQFPIPIINVVFIIQILFLLPAFYFLKNKKLKYQTHFFYIFLISFLFFISKTPARIMYFVILSPFVSVIFGLSIKYLYDYFEDKLVKKLILFISAVFIFSNIFYWFSFVNFLQKRQVIRGDYGRVFANTDSLVKKQIKPYNNFSDYKKMYLNSLILKTFDSFHLNLGQYFMSQNQLDLAIKEFEKALQTEDKLQARQYLIAIFYKTNQKKLLEKQLQLLEQEDATKASQLRKRIKP